MPFTHTPTVPAGFVSAAPIGRPLAARSALSSTSRTTLRPVAARRTCLRMTLVPDAPPTGGEEPTGDPTSAADILSEMRTTAAENKGPRTLNTGVTRDMDGKSNVWAVEPTERVDDKPEDNKAIVFGAVIAAAIFALILLPRLPFINADQF